MEQSRHTPGHILLDVREKVQFDILHLGSAVHLPLSQLQDPESSASKDFQRLVQDRVKERGKVLLISMCRRGRMSQTATRLLSQRFVDLVPGHVEALNLTGGLFGLTAVFSNFPVY